MHAWVASVWHCTHKQNSPRSAAHGSPMGELGGVGVGAGDTAAGAGAGEAGAGAGELQHKQHMMGTS
jgi:hypothetical protein